MDFYHNFLIQLYLSCQSLFVFFEKALLVTQSSFAKDKWRHDIKEIVFKSNEKCTLAYFLRPPLSTACIYIYVLLSNSRVHFGVHVLQRARATI